MKKLLKKVKLWRGLTAMMCVILALGISMTELLFRWSGLVNLFLGVEPPAVETEGDLYYDIGYTQDKAGFAKMIADSDKHDVQTMEEGAVLIKNDENTLPLASNERKVTLFGAATANPFYRGNSGGAGLDSNRVVNLRSALEAENFSINTAIYDAYEADWNAKKLERKAGDSAVGSEEPVSFYDSYKNTFDNYSDVAIVMFARTAGEGIDHKQVDSEGISSLALHKNEADLLKMIKESGKFKKTIVLINSSWAMELDYLFDEQYGVDAALWIGGPALKGFTGVANILVGKADPSGSFTDTYATDSRSSAAAKNSGAYRFTNDNFNRSYLIQAEGIYMGYKYYETRYHDQVLNRNNATGSAGVFASNDNKWNYADEIVFPFGYGLSYTNFTQELQNVVWDKEAHTVTANVKVTNNGAPDGSNYTGKTKSVVQLYVSLPWEEGQAEKSAIQLIGFGKTKALDKGESEVVTITVDDYLFATYDRKATNGADESKKGCYVFDKGNYYFAIGNDSHDALNNVLAAQSKTGLVDAFGNSVAGVAANVHMETLAALDNTSYARSRETGNVVSNLFDDVDYNYWKEGTVTYLTRADWNTFPKSYEGLSATDEMIAYYNDKTWDVPENAPSYDSFTQNADVTIKFVELKDLEWEDEKWEAFLDQLSIREMTYMTGENFGQAAIKDVGKPKNTNTDGPSGAQNSYLSKYGGGAATQHVNEVVAASSFNPELLYERGKFIACDCVYVGTHQLWAPGANLHRTPFSGRNFEYYSEDSIMSYLCGDYQTTGMQDYGCNAAIKHFAGNDQETGREDMHNLMTEQHLRQDSLKGFEGAYVADGGALSSMMSFTSYGMHSEFYSDRNVLTGVVRNEWGWKGVNITDNVRNNKTMNGVEALVAGTDTFNAGPQFGDEINAYLKEHKDGYVLSCLRQANKRFFYAMSRSTLINGLSIETEVSDFVPWWQPTTIALCCVVGVVGLGCATMYVLSGYVFKKKEQGIEEEVNTEEKINE